MHRFSPRCKFEEAGLPGDSSLETYPVRENPHTSLDLPGHPRFTTDILGIGQILCQIVAGVKESSVNAQERIYK